MLIGVSSRPQYADWDSMREAASAVDELGSPALPTDVEPVLPEVSLTLGCQSFNLGGANARNHDPA